MPGRGDAKAPPFIAPTPPLRVEMGGEIEAHDDAEVEVEVEVKGVKQRRTTGRKMKFIYVLIEEGREAEGRKAMKCRGGLELFCHSFFLFTFCGVSCVPNKTNVFRIVKQRCPHSSHIPHPDCESFRIKK
jgi:hypothetical protein